MICSSKGLVAAIPFGIVPISGFGAAPDFPLGAYLRPNFVLDVSPPAHGRSKLSNKVNPDTT